MLPNFTIVVCGAILTVMMLAVAGSGLITPETRTRIGEMPEVGRPMMQHMISEPAGQAQFAALDVSRRAEEIGRLRDLAPSTLVSAPAPAAWDSEPVQEPAKETTPSVTAEHPDETAAPAVAAVTVPAPVIVAAVVPVPPPTAPHPAAPPSALQADGKTVADRLPADSGDTPVDAIEATIPRPGATGSQATAALADTEEVAPQVAPQVAPTALGARLNIRLPRAARARVGAKAAALARRPVRHAIRRPHRHLHRSYAAYRGSSYPFGPPGMPYR
jgi:hypothetical protein